MNTRIPQTRSRKPRAIYFVLPLLLGLPIIPTSSTEDPLHYQDRGDRHEGIRRRPISGYDLELLAVMAEGDSTGAQPSTNGPSTNGMLGFRFYLPYNEPVFVTVREQEPPRFYYWLDEVQPHKPWRERATNQFQWPAQDVAQPLGLKTSDLTVLVRLGHGEASVRERVAPAHLNTTEGGFEVRSYRFLWKTNATAEIEAHISAPGDTTFETTSDCGKRFRPAISCGVEWQPGRRTNGLYRLVLKGRFLSDNTPIYQEVEFFHSNTWPP